MSDKPREFWITDIDRYSLPHEIHKTDTGYDWDIHAIEHSAYQLLEQRLSEALVKIAELQNDLDDLRKQNEETERLYRQCKDANKWLSDDYIKLKASINGDTNA